MVWKNVPIPETIILPLIAGVTLDIFFPLKFFQLKTPLLLIASLATLVGLVLMSWSVFTAGKLDIGSPNILLNSGPYAYSRNPMYVSWLIIFIGGLIFLRSIWLVLGFVVASLLTHYLAILPEEKYLSEQFGDLYESYCRNVRRYL